MKQTEIGHFEFDYMSHQLKVEAGMSKSTLIASGIGVAVGIGMRVWGEKMNKPESGIGKKLASVGLRWGGTGLMAAGVIVGGKSIKELVDNDRQYFALIREVQNQPRPVSKEFSYKGAERWFA